MHLNHKPGEIMQVDRAGDTASVTDTDTGEIIPAYVFVATLPYSSNGKLYCRKCGDWMPVHPCTHPKEGGDGNG